MDGVIAHHENEHGTISFGCQACRKACRKIYQSRKTCQSHLRYKHPSELEFTPKFYDRQTKELLPTEAAKARFGSNDYQARIYIQTPYDLHRIGTPIVRPQGAGISESSARDDLSDPYSLSGESHSLLDEILMAMPSDLNYYYLDENDIVAAGGICNDI
jgi:hypothetical protein